MIIIGDFARLIQVSVVTLRHYDEIGLFKPAQVKVYELPQVQVAAVVHHGAFENFRQEHTALFAWIEANGYRIADPYREIYINHNPGNMADSATEIQYPVEKGVGE